MHTFTPVGGTRRSERGLRVYIRVWLAVTHKRREGIYVSWFSFSMFHHSPHDRLLYHGGWELGHKMLKLVRACISSS